MGSSSVAPLEVELPPRPALHPDLSPGLPPVDLARARDAASVSGKAIPLGDLSGWKQTMAADFEDSRLPKGWVAYHGLPGGPGHGWWDPAQVLVHQGQLSLEGCWVDGIFTTGGVMAWGVPQTYGKYEVRFRAQRAHGVKYALLLWPAYGGWPAAGEVDFAEDGDGARQGTTATLHHGAANEQEQRALSADFSRWQTVGVEWTPGRLVYTLNGRPWAHVDSAGVPTGPMNLALQLEAGAGDQWSSAPDARTPAHVALDVDWVVSYRRA
jgi:beta-glucanase (GH16 family)